MIIPGIIIVSAIKIAGVAGYFFFRKNRKKKTAPGETKSTETNEAKEVKKNSQCNNLKTK